ncbi:serine/threonine-protein phosphatase [Streptomyces sp. RY43-2]|uniref:Serine/threonine-protein phosphatase n=1 Tax=Streptomyces macrolidinus TaxID=2952607 RepID=A0ABT0ZIK4_9ACTN|nr:PP2C family protein-serine/threonine phosphatase [Streptomyces macrolidinus]MCN9243391.1 serine/threonine-protein phosphatase [Streptomyces macrolidinus]
MGARRQHVARVWQPWLSSHVLLLIPITLIVLITFADVVTPRDIVLSPLLAIAPAITAWFEGPRVTAFIGALAVAGQALTGWRHDLLLSRNILAPMAALAILSGVVVFFCVVRDRQRRQLAQVRTVAEAAQHVLLWPLPTQLGPLQLACLYQAAEEEAEIGGDLYAAARTDSGARVMIGDVRGKGLPALGEAALLLGAFREAAHQHASLPRLAAALEHSIARYLTDFEPEHEGEAGERFVTALLLEFPDDEPVIRMTSCGHLAPMLLGPYHTVTMPSLHPAPPLGIGLTDPDQHALDVVPFGPGDTLLLYTDGIIEARDRHGTFYPLAERAAQWAGHHPEALLHHLQRDLIAHTDGRLDDDVALIAIRRTPVPHPGHHLGRTFQTGAFRYPSESTES